MYTPAIVGLPCMVASMALFAAGCQQQEQQAAPGQAVIVIQGVYSRQGVGDFRALSISDAPTIAKLEAFFPGYRDCPSGRFAGGWDAGYEVYFIFGDGRALWVMVSENGGGDTWSMGDGDFATQGDFRGFVESLIAKEGGRPSAAAAEP